MARALTSFLAIALALPSVALAGPAEGPASPASDDEAVIARSQQHTHPGAIELGLGTLLAGAAAGLSAYGAVTFVRAQEHLELCRAPVAGVAGAAGLDACSFDPPPLGFASAGLSWGLSLPLLVGAGMLLVRGAQLAADARRHKQARLSLGPWPRRRGAGASLTLRF